MNLAFPIEPMRAIAGALPRPDEDAQWAYEIKWDGMRIVAWIAADGSVRLQSANPREVTVTLSRAGRPGRGHRGPPRRARRRGRGARRRGAARRSGGCSSACTWRRRPRSPAGRRRCPWPTRCSTCSRFDGTDAVGLPYEHRRRLLEQTSSSRDRRGRCRPTTAVGAQPCWSRIGRARPRGPDGQAARPRPTSWAAARRRGARSRCAAARSSWWADGRPGEGRRSRRDRGAAGRRPRRATARCATPAGSAPASPTPS